jgi:CDP-diacylglycerol--glycerol-3-phosphate 3-phosphatidyltransferase
MALDTETVPSPARPPLWSLPNQLTVARVVLSIVMFVLLTYGHYAASFVLFVVAASTDWLDGYFARRWGLVTQLGRILDPFADKLIVCGTFIFLAATPGSHVPAWMAVVVMARELLVTALRSFLEKQGRDFSAELSGKLKMLFQCFAAGGSLFYLAWKPTWLTAPLDACLWGAVVLTVYSGATYVRRAIRLAQEE